MNKVVEARIEIPMGSQNKYEIDTKTNKIKLDRVLYSASFYPAEYGYVENTLGEDGDALDILVFTSYPTFPGCYVEAKIIGAMDMIDTGKGDYKLVAVNDRDPRYNEVNCLEDLPPHYLKQIDNFFSTYKNLQDVKTSVEGWMNLEEAYKLLDESIVRFNNK